jgi:two-component system phosphate regulon sensor histidine kinase PhoR
MSALLDHWWLAPALAAAAAGVWTLRRAGLWARALAGYAEAVADARPPGAPPRRPPGALGRLQAAVLRAFEQERTRAESARGEQRRLAGVLGGMREGVLVVGADGRVLLQNRRAEELLDVQPGEDFVGRPLIEMTRDPDLLRLVRRLMEGGSIDGGPPLEIGLYGLTPHVLQVSATPVDAGLDGGGAFILVLHDVSEAKRLDRMRRDFVANVSHELRTPLAAIAGYTETLLAGAVEDPDKARRFLAIVERHTERLGRLVNDLLTLSDLELGRTELHRAAVHPEDVIEAAFEVLRGRAAQQGVTLERQIAPDTPSLDADQHRLEQAVLNLVDNAIKYTPRGGRVVVRASSAAAPADAARRGEAQEYGEIAVEDTGIGVPPGDLPRLTERFYRVDKARSRELGGTGLGLAIVKHIVQAHGGAMSIDSELGRGTAVRLFMPAYDPRRAAAAAGDRPARLTASS